MTQAEEALKEAISEQGKQEAISGILKIGMISQRKEIATMCHELDNLRDIAAFGEAGIITVSKEKIENVREMIDKRQNDLDIKNNAYNEHFN